jgi:hypothetical protein
MVRAAAGGSRVMKVRVCDRCSGRLTSFMLVEK